MIQNTGITKGHCSTHNRQRDAAINTYLTTINTCTCTIKHTIATQYKQLHVLHCSPSCENRPGSELKICPGVDELYQDIDVELTELEEEISTGALGAGTGSLGAG